MGFDLYPQKMIIVHISSIHQMLKIPTLYIKNINNDNYFSLNNLGAIKPRILYDGIIRSKNMFTFQDNTNDEIDHAVRNFLNSLNSKKWKNYGKKFSIQQKNYDFHGIPKGLNKEVFR